MRKHFQSRRKLIILISIGVFVLLFSAYLHRFRSISQIISLDDVQKVSVFNGNTYYFTGEEGQDVLNRLDEIPVNKCIPEDITQEEWEQRISYLQMATIGQGLHPGKNYGNGDKVCKAIQLLSYVPYDHYHEALNLIRELRIVFDTQNLVVFAEEGDIEQVIQRLELLSVE